MKYKQELLSKLKHSEKWPFFKRPDFLGELDGLASNMYSKKTTEGYLGALLIYHQICEEMVKLLIECSDFFIQCSVFPLEFKETNLEGKMFGKLLSLLKQGVQDPKIPVFISKCEELNAIRIKIVHKLTLKTSIEEIGLQIKPAEMIFNSIEDIFFDLYDNYLTMFKDLKKDKFEF